MYLLVFAVVLAFTISSWALYRYGDVQRQNLIVTVAVLIAWCFSFLIVFAIPLDVSSTVYRQCVRDHNGTLPGNQTIDEVCQQPWGMVPEHVFPNLWRIIYWSSQFLTWLILPLLQSYMRAGDFTIKGKLKSSLIANMIYYGSYLFICIILLIYLALKPGVSLDWQKLKAIASSASNTWGLFLLILLFGYALVEVPRNLWNNSRPEFTLQYAYFKISKLSSEKSEAEEKVDEILESLNSVNKLVPQSHHHRPCVDEIMRKVPTELFEKYGRQNFGGRLANQDQQMAVPSEKSLVRLHRNVIQALEVLQRTEALWNVQVKKVLHLENVVRNLTSKDRHFKTEFKVVKGRFERIFWNSTLQWYWECMIYPPFLRILSVITASLSIMVIWSEVTFFNREPVLSIFANVINVGKRNYDFLSIEMFSMFILCYLCYCAFSTIFQIKFLNLYYLAPHHQTNEHSLIFSGTTLCRLVSPMCLNFLGMIHMDSHIIKTRISETYYTQIMGHMDVLAIISDGFNIYFPMLMVALCLATWYSLGSRALNSLGFDQFMIDQSISSELIEEGKELIGREKRKRQRAEEAIQRRANFTSTQMSDFPLGSTGGLSSNRTRVGPGDGLLKESADNFDYSTRGGDLSRSLSEEINARFGTSTQVAFKPSNSALDDDFDEGGGANYQNRRNLFDDV